MGLGWDCTGKKESFEMIKWMRKVGLGLVRSSRWFFDGVLGP